MGSSQEDIPEKQSGGQSWPLAKGTTTLGNSQADTHGHPSRRHPWETIKRTFVACSHEENTSKQSNEHSWAIAVKSTTLGNSGAYIHGH